MRILIAALALALTLADADAQMGTSPGGSNRPIDHRNVGPAKTEQAKPKADEKAYNSALKGLPDKPYDPWHGTR